MSGLLSDRTFAIGTPVHVLGATGRSGLALVRALRASGRHVIAVARAPERLPGDLADMPSRRADLTDPSALSMALRDARIVVSTAHARHLPAILRATSSDARIVALGSTRRFTRWPDAHGRGVLAGERAFLNSGRAGVLLHPTMIYGAEGEDNVQRLAALLARLPVVPLPGGGGALVQPIHQDDVTRCLLSAIDHAWDGPRTVVIAGPEALPYRAFIHEITRASGLRARPVLTVPKGLLIALSPLTRLPMLPRIGPDEIRRLGEDKAFDISEMRACLRVEPRPLSAGLAALFSGR